MNTRKIDLNLLVTLEALLAERNVTKAAERLGLSQPAVSTQLSRLRDVFGDELLAPARRGMTPTARALELEDALSRALNGVRHVLTHGEAFDPATAEMTVSIAAVDTVQSSILAPFAISIRSRAPSIRFAFRNFSSASLEQQMEEGTIDIGITASTFAPNGLRSRKLEDSRFALIARRNHPTVHQGLGLEQFLALEHVITEPNAVNFAGFTDKALETLGHKRKIVLSVSSFLAAADIVARSDLIAIVPHWVAVDHADALQVLTPPIDVPGYPILMLWHERNHAHAGHRWLRDALLASVKSRIDRDARLVSTEIS